MAKPRTVRELILQLQAVDPELLVSTEGCDCIGPWSGEVHVEDRVVYVGRDDKREDYEDWWIEFKGRKMPR